MVRTRGNAEEGWTVWIDGEESEWTTSLGETLLAVAVPEGKHDIVLEFVPAGLKIGIVFSVSGLLTFVTMILIALRQKKTREEKSSEKFEKTP